MSRRRTERVLTRRYDRRLGTPPTRRPDELIVEEPLTIRLDDIVVGTTMRTPGNDFELAAGFCFSDGLLAGAPVLGCRYCGTGSAIGTDFNVASVETGGAAPDPTPRLQMMSSSCGLCGTDQLNDLQLRLDPLPPSEPWSWELVHSLPSRVAGSQDLFGRTGSVHAAAVFDRAGEIVLLREDIGRHNAVDKIIGRLLFDDALPARDLGLFVSSRASYEIVQKAWSAGFGTLVAVSGPSALAVATATAARMTLVGFLRPDTMNIYTSPT